MAQKNAEEYRADAEDCGITQVAAKIVYADARNIGKGYADEIAKSAIAKVSGNGSKVTWELLLNEYASHEKLGANGYKQRRDRLERLLTEWYGTTTPDKPVDPDAPLEVTVYDSKQNTVNDGDILNGEYTVVISNVPSDYQNCVFINLKSTDDLYTIYAHQIIGDKAFVDFDTTKMQEASYKLSAFAYKFNDDIPKSYGYLNFKTKWEPIYEFEYKGNLIENNSTISITKNDAANVEFTFISNNRDINGNSLKTEVIRSVCYVDEKPVSNFISPYDAIVNKSSKHVIKNLSDKSHEIRITIDKVGEVIKEYNFTLIVSDRIKHLDKVFLQTDEQWGNEYYGWSWKSDENGKDIVYDAINIKVFKDKFTYDVDGSMDISHYIDASKTSKTKSGIYYYDKNGNSVVVKRNIYNSGCGLLTFVNAMYSLTGNFIEPVELAKYSLENGYRPFNSGTAPGLFKSYVEKNNLGITIGTKSDRPSTLEEREDWFETLANHLKNGGVAIGNFPGHYMAIIDYNEEKGFLIYDSYPSPNRGGKGKCSYWKNMGELNKKYTESGKINKNYLEYYIFMSK